MQQLFKPTTQMRKIVFPVIALLLAVSCSKDNDNAEKVIDPGDAVTVAASITVMHSEKQTGTMPSSSNNAPVMFPFEGPLKTIAGKYVVIQPSLQSGTAAGYFLQVKGASGYFKVNGAASSGFIIVQLPQNIEPGSFKILNNVFDANNNVSNTSEATIQIEKLGGTGIENFAGTWKLTGELKPYNAWDYKVYDRKNGYSYSFNCINNKIGSLHVGQDPYPTVFIPLQQFLLKKSEWVIETGGTMQQDYQKDAFILDYSLSTCSNVLYKPDPPTNNYWIGINGWVYNASAKRISFLYNYETPATPVQSTYSEEFEVVEISATKMIIRSTIDDKYAWEYSKQ